MAQQKIYLRKVRDFGENLADTFQFLRQEFKPMMRSFLLIAGVFLLGAAIVSGIYQTQLSETLMDGRNDDQFGDRFVWIFVGKYSVIFLCMLVALSAMQAVVAAYMKLYDLNGSSPALEAVWSEFSKHILKILLLGVMKVVLYLIGAMLCILPGVYLAIVFAPMTFVVVNENVSISEAFSRCFALARQNFWTSVAIYIVAYIIYSVASGALGFSLELITGVEQLFSENYTPGPGDAVVNSITNLFGYLFYVVFIISVGLNYYTMEESADGTGIMRRLETLGGGSPSHQNEEQY